MQSFLRLLSASVCFAIILLSLTDMSLAQQSDQNHTNGLVLLGPKGVLAIVFALFLLKKGLANNSIQFGGHWRNKKASPQKKPENYQPFKSAENANIKDKATVRIIRYCSDHWNGNLSLNKSFFVNGVLFYFLLAVMIMPLEIVFGTSPVVYRFYLGLLISGMTWSIVGIARVSIKTLKKKNSSIGKKAFAVGVIVFIAINLLAIIRDLLG